MASSYPLVVTHQYREESQKWMTAIKRRENVVVVFFPKTDRLLRMQQLLENPADQRPILGDASKFLFLVFEFGLQNIEDQRDLHNHIAGKLNYTQLLPRPQTFEQWVEYFQKHNRYLVLVNPQVDKLWSVEGHVAQTALSYLVDEFNPLITTLSFSEVDLTHPQILPFLPDSMRLYQNIFYYPLYLPSDSVFFSRYMQTKWNMQIKPDVEKRIIDDCGGHFWLLKEALRQTDADTYPMYPGEGLKFRLDVIYQLLTPSAQNVLTKLMRGKENFNEEEIHSLEFLTKMRLIDEKKHCRIGFFTDYILTRSQNKTDLIVRDNRVILNQVPLEKFFSRKEYRVIKILLEKRGQTVSRDEIAHHIWPANTQEHYSDWAIDQLIARVRRRLQHLSLSPKLVQSIRGKGYLLKLS